MRPGAGRTRGARSLGALLAAALAWAGCAGAGAAAPVGVRQAPPPGDVTPAFGGMRTVVVALASAAQTGDLPAIRARRGEVVAHGLGLLGATLPHDLRDADVARFEDARAAFGEALRRFVHAVDEHDDARLGETTRELVDAYWAWLDTYKGEAPEHSV